MGVPKFAPLEQTSCGLSGLFSGQHMFWCQFLSFYVHSPGTRKAGQDRLIAKYGDCAGAMRACDAPARLFCVELYMEPVVNGSPVVGAAGWRRFLEMTAMLKLGVVRRVFLDLTRRIH